MVVLAGGGGGGGGEVPVLGVLLPPELHAARTTAVNNAATELKCCFMMSPFLFKRAARPAAFSA
jgi:hypothetical protein